MQGQPPDGPALPDDSLAPAPQPGRANWRGHTPPLVPPPGGVYPHSTVHPLSSVIFAPSFTLSLKMTKASGKEPPSSCTEVLNVLGCGMYNIRP